MSEKDKRVEMFSVTPSVPIQRSELRICADEDFLCSRSPQPYSNQISCDGCRDGMQKNIRYRFDEKPFFKWENKLTTGGCSKVYNGMFHGRHAVFKVITVNGTTAANRGEIKKQIIQEFKIQRECSRAPRPNDSYLHYSWKERARERPGDEKFVLAPLACFEISNASNPEHQWIVIVTPKYE